MKILINAFNQLSTSKNKKLHQPMTYEIKTRETANQFPNLSTHESNKLENLMEKEIALSFVTRF